MYIQPNKLLAPTNRVIRPYQCAMIATEGPNILGKLNMSGVEIPYDSQFSTRMTLNPGAVKQPLLYGFLGSEVTFVMLKITFDETDPRCNIEEEQYIEYYFETEPSIIRYANKLLLLTGNSVKRIPQIFLQNPSEVKVIVEALVANLDQSDIDISNVNVVTIGNLYYNNVLSNIVLIDCLTSGSTQLQVYGIDTPQYPQLYLDYVDILTIEPQYMTNELKITTISDSMIILGFLSSFEMYQALSRISWVMKTLNNMTGISTRWLTKDDPGLDVTAPVWGMNPDLPSPLPSPIPYTDFATGSTILPRDIVDFFITGVTDMRDGEISVDSVYITIRRQGSVEPLTGITVVGVYDIVLSVSDIANNTAISNYTILVDNVPPIITFIAPTAIGSGFTMTETDMALPSLGITAVDIINKSVDYVYDTVDGSIDKYTIDIWIGTISGITPMTLITSPGTYDLTFIVKDYADNWFTSGKTLTYEGKKILDGGENYTIPTGMVSMNFEYVGESGVTGTTVTISGKTFSVTNISGVTSGMTTGITEVLIWDSVGTDSGGTYYHDFGTGSTDSFTFEVNGTVFTITFTGRGSLLFTLTNDGPVIDHFEIVPTSLFYSYDAGITNVFGISTNLDWTIVSTGVSWITLSSLSGTGSAIIDATTNEYNGTGLVRSGLTSISVTSGMTTVTIDVLMTQETEFYFYASVTGMTYAAGSGSTSVFDIVTNLNWEIYDSVDWLDISSYSGTGNATITTTAIENTGSERTNRIFIIGNLGVHHEVLDIIVTQDGV